MIEQINRLIEINLQLLFASERKALSLVDFRNDQGKPLPGAKMLAEVMQQKELIRLKENHEFSYELTELGKSIAETGGWLKHYDKFKRDNNPDFKAPQNDTRKLNTHLLIIGIIIAFLSILIVSCI
ncbi:hypothetical protein [Flavobacterium nitrogenifigens]|uniref:hypothetical protein n=1 Tax=Flavobacterium nitrogenifigens TaxID=1617283 RepID=UPI0031AD9F9A